MSATRFNLSLLAVLLIGSGTLLASKTTGVTVATQSSTLSAGPETTPDQTRGTFSFPADCTDKDCLIQLSYGVSSTNDSRVAMTIRGPADPAGNYIAVGVNWQSKMDYAMVIECVYWTENSKEMTQLFGSFNIPDHKNQRVGVDGIYEQSSRNENGMLECDFEVDVVRTVTGITVAPPGNLTFDLKQPYYLLLARGPLVAGGNEKDYHDVNKTKSANMVVIYDGGDIVPTSPSTTSDITTSTPAISSTVAPPNNTGVFTLPSDCSGPETCLITLTYGVSRRNISRVAMTLQGPSAPDNQPFYLAVGINQQNLMDFATVVECVSWNPTKKISTSIFSSYNLKGHENKRGITPGLYPIDFKNENGMTKCEFELDVLRTVGSAVGPANTTFDLTQPYYLLLARGGMTGDKKDFHYENKTVTAAPVTLYNVNPVYDQCGKSRRCFGVPENCILTGTCLQLLSYGDSEDSKTIPVMMYGTAPNSTFADNFWVGFGSSISGGMANAAVVQCATSPDGKSTVVAAYNDMTSSYDILSDSRLGITDFSGFLEDGYLWCSFNLDVKRNVSGIIFDLASPYHLLLGGGKCRLADNSTTQYRPSKHIDTPHIFPGIVMSCGNDCPCADGNCFGVPENCEQTNTCDLLLSWTQVENRKSVSVSLSGVPPSPAHASSFWIGFGVSETTAMANTAVIQCVNYADGKQGIIAAYNRPRYSYTPLNDSHYGFSNGNISLQDGRLSCMFELDVNRTMFGEQFDVREYLHILLGSGPVNETTGAIRKHIDRPRVSKSEVALACDTNCIYVPTTPVPSTSAKPTGPPNQGNGTFGYPADCVEQDCLVFVKYGANSTNASRVAMTLRGPAEPANAGYYVAVGINWQAKMDYAMVIECVHWTENSKDMAQLFGSFNIPEHKNQRLGVDGIYEQSSKNENGMLECNFEVDVIRTVTGITVAPPGNLTFDLKQPYYLLLARGPLVAGGSQKDYHGVNKIASGDKVIVYNGGNAVPGVFNKTMKKTHAILMVLAWLWCASFGILNARQTKEMWPQREPFGLKMWFFLHRMDMVLATLLSIVGIIIVFVDVGGWRDIPHAYTGIVTFTLSLIQPVIATFRPHPGTPKRPYFNYVHWTLGYSALLLSGVSMFLGLKLEVLGAPKGSEYVIVATFVANIVLQLVLEIYKVVGVKSIEVSESKEDIVDDDYSRTTSTKETVTRTLHPNDPVRYTILMLDWILITAGSFTAVAMIAQA